MTIRSSIAVALAAIFFAALPAAVLADSYLYVNGQGDLRPNDLNGCNKYGTMSIRCTSYGPTAISFKDDKTGKVCAWRVVNESVGFNKRRWHIEPFPGKIENPMICTYHWTNDNTVDISAKK